MSEFPFSLSLSRSLCSIYKKFATLTRIRLQVRRQSGVSASEWGKRAVTPGEFRKRASIMEFTFQRKNVRRDRGQLRSSIDRAIASKLHKVERQARALSKLLQHSREMANVRIYTHTVTVVVVIAIEIIAAYPLSCRHSCVAATSRAHIPRATWLYSKRIPPFTRYTDRSNIEFGFRLTRNRPEKTAGLSRARSPRNPRLLA